MKRWLLPHPFLTPVLAMIWLLLANSIAPGQILLGLLLGAVVGLWPFQAGVAPEAGTSFRGDMVVLRDGVPWMEQADREIEPKDWPTDFFAPSAGQVAGSLALVGLGLATSLGIGRLGREKPARGTAGPAAS